MRWLLALALLIGGVVTSHAQSFGNGNVCNMFPGHCRTQGIRPIESMTKTRPALPARKPIYLRGEAFRVNCMDMYGQALACAIRYPYPNATRCKIYINADKVKRGTALARYAEAHERMHCAGYTH